MKRPTDTPAAVVDQDGQLIAFESTAQAFGRARWTELAVWYLHNPGPGGKRWLARASGYSTREGERNRHTALCAGTLERALKVVDESTDIGVVVAETAREWSEDNAVTIANGKSGPVTFADDAAALAWLYGEPDEGHDGFARMLSRDTGAGESTIRMALAAGRDVKVPLRAFLPFLDRAAFRRARETARG